MKLGEYIRNLLSARKNEASIAPEVYDRNFEIAFDNELRSFGASTGRMTSAAPQTREQWEEEQARAKAAARQEAREASTRRAYLGDGM